MLWTLDPSGHYVDRVRLGQKPALRKRTFPYCKSQADQRFSRASPWTNRSTAGRAAIQSIPGNANLRRREDCP
ncbi:hypothetical protein G3O06_00290 [Burkholderia sp. Ac-20345]|nr:hypothetical protein [Burkholderia sp. Ac-20345]